MRVVMRLKQLQASYTRSLRPHTLSLRPHALVREALMRVVMSQAHAVLNRPADAMRVVKRPAANVCSKEAKESV